MAITKAKMKLVGIDGNAFNIMGHAINAMKKAKVSKEIIDAYQKEAMSGTYNNLLCVTMDYIECNEEENI